MGAYVRARLKITVKHEKHSLQSPRASAATPCDAVLSMDYKYILLSSEGPQRRDALIPSAHKCVSIKRVEKTEKKTVWNTLSYVEKERKQEV